MDELREVIARAIYKLNPEKQPWDGDAFLWHEPRSDGYRKDLAWRQADAVIAALDETP